MSNTSVVFPHATLGYPDPQTTFLQLEDFHALITVEDGPSLFVPKGDNRERVGRMGFTWNKDEHKIFQAYYETDCSNGISWMEMQFPWNGVDDVAVDVHVVGRVGLAWKGDYTPTVFEIRAKLAL